MAKRWRQYSYQDQKNYLRRIRGGVLWLVIFFLLYTLLTGFFLSNRRLENSAMEPGCKAGDRLFFSNYAFTYLLRDARGEAELPYKRGQIVLVDRSTGEKKGAVKPALDSLLRFCTFQRMSLFPRDDTVFVKRVIALPGDTVTINNFAVRVKPAGDSYEYTESELSVRDYVPGIPEIPVLWDSSIPFSSSMESVTLKSGECFVLSDNRSNTNDSRTWGPVPVFSIRGGALLRYWPFTRIGRP